MVKTVSSNNIEKTNNQNFFFLWDSRREMAQIKLNRRISANQLDLFICIISIQKHMYAYE